MARNLIKYSFLALFLIVNMGCACGREVHGMYEGNLNRYDKYGPIKPPKPPAEPPKPQVAPLTVSTAVTVNVI